MSIDDMECITCGEEQGSKVEYRGECPESKRLCGHHCNCSWTQDYCHFCEQEMTGEKPTLWCAHCGEQGLYRLGGVCKLCHYTDEEPFRVGWDESS